MDSEGYFPQVKNYVDFQGLASLKQRVNSDSGKREAAQQFESLLVQMMLKSMRSANEAFTNEDNHSDAFSMYQDWFDKQVSLSVKGLGIAQLIETYLNRMEDNSDTISKSTSNHVANVLSQTKMDKSSDKPVHFKNTKDFISSLMPYAKFAARKLGLHPGVMLAQAALETNWGKSIIGHAKKDFTFNLFNIKADPSWSKSKKTVDTLENKDGVLIQEKTAFRKYDSFSQSFDDYVKFLKSNPRYQQALAKVTNPTEFLQELQNAHYATDPSYANKIMSIFNSRSFQKLISKST